MSERTAYDQGWISWVDLSTSDVGAAKAFYTGLFGWEYDEQTAPTGTVYAMAQIRGKNVAGIGAQPPDQAAAGVPPAWNTWIAVDSVDAALEAATEAGGTVLMPAMDIPGSGRMAYITDPSGAPVGLWQATQHIGAQLVSEPGAIIWNELQTNDLDADFYSRLAGIGTQETAMGGDGPPYTTFVVGESTIGGTMAPAMEGTPNHWHVYFGTDDVEGTMAKAKDLGGQVLAGPIPTPIGPMATLQDPQGAVFTVFHPDEWPT